MDCFTFFSSQSVRQPSLSQLPLQAQFKKVFGKEWKLAIAIAKAESNLNCKVISKPNKNGTRDSGLFQLNDAYHPYIPDCLENMLRAKKIRDSWGNWKAWSAYNNKKYLRFYEK